VGGDPTRNVPLQVKNAGQGQLPDGAGTEASARARIDRAVARAHANLFWEAIWPLTAPFVTLAALFAALSWFGLWRLTAAPLRFAILALFVAAVAYYLWRAFRFVMPSRMAAFSRVEQATGEPHRPATSFSDRLATAPDDPAGQALWFAHRQRLLAALGNIRAGSAAPRLDRHDPFALRFLVAILFVVGFVTAGPERIERMGEAFRGGESAAATVARIDAWVTPPAYTGRPPIFLTGEAARPPGTEFTVPAGSVVTVRTGGARDLSVVSANGEGETPVLPAEAEQAAAANEAAPPLEHQVTLDASGSVLVRKGSREVSEWSFVVKPDEPPAIALAEDPRVAASGALHLIYSLKDDYGVVGARAEFAPVAGQDDSDARPLYEAPAMALSLPQLRIREGNGDTTRDLTSHPWAGAAVEMTLVATDEANQEGRSAAREITLPARRFFDPLARAVVEQRTKLALDANADLRVADALDALTMSPEGTIDNVTHYLALRSAYHRLVYAHDDEELRGVVDYLWTIALAIEDGGLSLVAQALRDAQERLREALENGATDEEIARLTDELRQALQEFMQALAEEAMRNPQAMQVPPDANMQMLSQDQLEQMLDRIEELARTGARDAARQLLSELQNMLENLQAGQPQMGNPQAGQMMESLDQLGEMIQRQEELMNRTFRAERGQGENGEPLSPEEMEQLLQQLQEQQEALAQQLQELMEGMEGMGMQPNGKLGQAGEAMGRAGEELGAGSPGSAVGEQSSALDALRQGAQGLAQQFANQQGQGQGMGPGFRNGDMRYPNEDPLGRPQRTTGPDLGTTVKVPDEIDTQRAREILDAIRERLGEAFRPEIEREYLERLLDQF
jgi:uncharacterized protein (TIGR02302 family)